MNILQYRKVITEYAAHLEVMGVWGDLLRIYPQFEYWSGSHKPDYHHYGQGGLIQHTSEVIDLGLHTLPLLHRIGEVDEIEFFLSALFHDTGKMYDYTSTDEQNNNWVPKEHKRLIHHIPRSLLIWHDIIAKYPELNNQYHDRVAHNILSHHGSREFGSPVAPKTKEAWLLHLCDGISARMDDADRIDLVNKPYLSS